MTLKLGLIDGTPDGDSEGFILAVGIPEGRELKLGAIDGAVSRRCWKDDWCTSVVLGLVEFTNLLSDSFLERVRSLLDLNVDVDRVVFSTQ